MLLAEATFYLKQTWSTLRSPQQTLHRIILLKCHGLPVLNLKVLEKKIVVKELSQGCKAGYQKISKYHNYRKTGQNSVGNMPEGTGEKLNELVILFARQLCRVY